MSHSVKIRDEQTTELTKRRKARRLHAQAVRRGTIEKCREAQAVKEYAR